MPQMGPLSWVSIWFSVLCLLLVALTFVHFQFKSSFKPSFNKKSASRRIWKW